MAPPTTTAKSLTEIPLFQCEIPELKNFSSNPSLNRKILSSAKVLTAKEGFSAATAAQTQSLYKELLSDDTKLNTTKTLHKNKERNDHNKNKEEEDGRRKTYSH